MSDYTPAEIEAALEDAEDQYGDPCTWGDVAYGLAPKEITLRGEAVPFAVADGKTGVEGGGEDIYLIVKAGEQYFEKTGYYMSHDGSTWDGDLHEVRPVVKTVTVYE